MEMSNALQKNLMQLFPNKIIYSAELCKNISVHMALHREAKRAGVSSRQLTESNGFVWKDIERAMDFSGEKVDESLEVVPVINQIYTTQTFLGNAILTEEQRIAVYSYAKSAFDKRFVEGKGCPLQKKKQLFLKRFSRCKGEVRTMTNRKVKFGCLYLSTSADIHWDKVQRNISTIIASFAKRLIR